MKTTLLRLALLAVCALVLFPSGVQSSDGVLKVGSAAVDISPTEFPVAVDGYFELRYFDKVRDPLFARAIVIENGDQRFVIATIDTMLANADFISQIKQKVSDKSGFPADRISISSTHTHFAPQNVTPGSGSIQARHSQKVIEGTANAILQAIENVQPAKFGWGTCREPRHVFCRRYIMKPGTVWDEPLEFVGVERNIAQMNPPRGSANIISRTGVPDQTIYVAAFQTLDGKPLALLANYSTHYAGGEETLSSDYFGIFAKRIAEKLDAPKNFVAMMTNGTSGDTNCIDALNPKQEPFDRDLVGERVAEDVFNVLKDIKEYKTDAPVLAAAKTINLKYRKPTSEEIQFAKDYLVEADKYLAAKKEGKKVDNTEAVTVTKDRFKTTTISYARRTLRQVSLPESVDVLLQTFAVGNFGICTIPNEVFSFTGHDLRANSPFQPTIVISLANGYNGYLPTYDQFELGGYTTWRGTSFLERMAEPTIRAQLLDMLRQIAP